MRSDGGIKPVTDFWKNGAQWRSFFYFTPLSLFSVLSCFIAHLGDSRRRRLAVSGVFKANVTANRELQVHQTWEQALITPLPVADNRSGQRLLLNA